MRKVFQGKYYIDYITDAKEEPSEYIEIQRFSKV